MNIKQVPFKDFYREESVKKQIYLHHTAGTGSGDNVFSWWGKDKPRIATCVVIDRNGTIVQGFDSKYWAYHLGLTNQMFKDNGASWVNLDKISIGIELIAWGQLTKKGEKFYSYTGKEIKGDEVTTLSKPHRGFKHYHSYTQAQIDSVIDLLKLWEKRYGIDISFNADIFDVTPRAFKGESGVFTHCSVRKDKVDIFPCPKLIEALKTL